MTATINDSKKTETDQIQYQNILVWISVMKYNALQIAILLVSAVFLSGCCSTLHEQKLAELKLLNQNILYSENVLDELNNNKNPSKHVLHLFLSHDVVNKAFSEIDNYSFPLPNIPHTNLIIKNIHIKNYGASPVVSIEAIAINEIMDLEVKVEVTAILTKVESGNSGEFKFQILSFVPSARWMFFQIKKSSFIKALMNEKIDAINNQMPSINFPLNNFISLGNPNQESQVTIPTTENSTLDLRIGMKSTLSKKKVKLHYYFVQSGIHIIGE